MPPGLASDIVDHTCEHLYLVAVSMAIAIAISVPAGILLARRSRVRPWAFGFANIMQTVPSLALFGLLIPVPLIGGLRPRMAIFALTLYALLPILRNTMTGILAVDPAVRESAVAMGMRSGEMLRQVELPLAARTILAGIRVATVTTVGTATIGGFINAGGLGVLIYRGLQSMDTTLLLAGAIPAAVLALTADGVLGWIEKRLAVS